MSKLRTRISLVAVGGILLGLAGCQTVPWLVQFFARPEKVEPVCSIPPDARMLVLVSDLELSESVDCAAIKRDLTDSLNKQLLAHEVAAEVVPYEELLELVADEPVFNQMSFGDIGNRLDADLVLYVRLKQFKLKDTDVGPSWHGELDVQVKLVDQDNHTLWPLDQPLGYAVGPVVVSGRQESSETYGVKLTEELAEEMANRIAKLFYEYEVPAGTKTRQQRQRENQDI